MHGASIGISFQEFQSGGLLWKTGLNLPIRRRSSKALGSRLQNRIGSGVLTNNPVLMQQAGKQ